MTLRKWIENDTDDVFVRTGTGKAVPIDKIPEMWYDYKVESVDRHIKDDGSFKEVITVWSGTKV